jgi:arabinose-5-phosphate isomerase
MTKGKVRRVEFLSSSIENGLESMELSSVIANDLLRKTRSTDQNILARGQDVIAAESSALAELGASLDENFAIATRLLAATSGRVVVTGMGKSGHIARKIAATLSATGTPAIFLHPAEAAHGDLGVIQRGDTLLVLSNSGMTTELRAVMQHSRGLGIRTIGVASRIDSPMMLEADVQLALPPIREACSANIAPTTSTVMMLALGDALAMALMDLRGISRESIKQLHPGGSIGLRLKTVAEMMHVGNRIPLVEGRAPMRDVIMTMTSMGFGVAGVTDWSGRLVGVITDGDLRRHIGDLLDRSAADVMTPHPKTVPADMLAEDALLIMNDAKITTVFVMTADDRDRPAGIVHIHDFVRHGLS